MATARMPSYKAGMRAAQGNHLQRSSLLTKKPTWPQAWKVAASGQSVHKVSDYLVKNNPQEARGDVLKILRNFPNSHEQYKKNSRDPCNLFHPIQPQINTSQKELKRIVLTINSDNYDIRRRAPNSDGRQGKDEKLLRTLENSPFLIRVTVLQRSWTLSGISAPKDTEREMSYFLQMGGYFLTSSILVTSHFTASLVFRER